MKTTPLFYVYLIVPMLWAGSVEASAILAGRDSELNANYLIGAGTEGRTGGGADSETSTDQRPAIQIAGSDDLSGFLLGEPWSASVQYGAGHQFLLDDSGGELIRITGTGSTEVSSVVTGLGSASVSVRAPGNRLELQFVVDSPTSYSLLARAEDTGGATSASVQMALGSGGLWAPFVLVSDTSLLDEGVLMPGLYRVVGSASGQATGNDNGLSVFNFDLSFRPVPIPATAWLLSSALGVMLLARRRRG